MARFRRPPRPQGREGERLGATAPIFSTAAALKVRSGALSARQLFLLPPIEVGNRN